MLLTLEQIFGQGTVENASTISIPKSGLSGLSASASNSPESLLAAILINALRQFQGEITANGQTLNANGNPLTYSNKKYWYALINLEPWTTFFENGKVVHTFVFHSYRFNLIMDFIDLPEKVSPALIDLLVLQDPTNEVTYKTLISSLPFLSSTNNKPDYFRQATVPTNPQAGTQWDEIDANGHLIESWVYTGTQWESRIKEFNWFLSGSGGNSTGYPVRNDYRYKILTWEYTLIANNIWNASNFVAVTLWRSSGATNTVLSTATYNSATAGQIRQIKTELKQTLDFQVTIADRLALGVSVTGTVTFNYSALIKYQLIRR
ncbi:hypothetical protein [Calothrix sp. 336/3]|uniref:hypothetical protein n=1 Tax=Calothrix sp. 336/3 TaxID=1337936 RepID=UPI0004E34E9F|nr:hypothetical protein [Calothrix sp. 336/3]AKG21488.1 hypothetical protein IJ00_09525 [Calothrix sp. 336/3]